MNQGQWEASSFIRQAAELLEAQLEDESHGTRRWAEVSLAIHYLINASSLLIRGKPAPSDLPWAEQEAKKILRAEK